MQVRKIRENTSFRFFLMLVEASLWIQYITHCPHLPLSAQSVLRILFSYNSSLLILPRYNWWNTSPSLMNRTLFAVLAAFTLCVTIRMVCPCWLISLNKRSSSSAARESSAPVGSSARISFGCVISALATAALCFWPPDTSYGNFFKSWVIPSCCAIGLSFWLISGYFFAGKYHRKIDIVLQRKCIQKIEILKYKSQILPAKCCHFFIADLSQISSFQVHLSRMLVYPALPRIILKSVVFSRIRTLPWSPHILSPPPKSSHWKAPVPDFLQIVWYIVFFRFFTSSNVIVIPSFHFSRFLTSRLL